MTDFIKSFTKIQENKVSLGTCNEISGQIFRPLVAGLFLVCFERAFMKSLTKENGMT